MEIRIKITTERVAGALGLILIAPLVLAVLFLFSMPSDMQDYSGVSSEDKAYDAYFSRVVTGDPTVESVQISIFEGEKMISHQKFIGANFNIRPEMTFKKMEDAYFLRIEEFDSRNVWQYTITDKKVMLSATLARQDYAGEALYIDDPEMIENILPRSQFRVYEWQYLEK